MLDIDLGTYVRDKQHTYHCICVYRVGGGAPPHAIKNVYGVAKAYCTRVDNGPVPSELVGAEAMLYGLLDANTELQLTGPDDVDGSTWYSRNTRCVLMA